MKRIIQGVLFLLLFGAFILASQISCQKINAQTNSTQTTPVANLILYGKNAYVEVGPPIIDSGRDIQVSTLNYQFYIANIDGSNNRQIPITLPSGLYVGSNGWGLQGYLTPGGQAIVFCVHDQSYKVYSIYSCSIDGNNLKKVLDIDNRTTTLLGAY